MALSIVFIGCPWLNVKGMISFSSLNFLSFLGLFCSWILQSESFCGIIQINDFQLTLKLSITIQRKIFFEHVIGLLVSLSLLSQILLASFFYQKGYQPLKYVIAYDNRKLQIYLQQWGQQRGIQKQWYITFPQRTVWFWGMK